MKRGNDVEWFWCKLLQEQKASCFFGITFLMSMPHLNIFDVKYPSFLRGLYTKTKENPLT